MLETYLKYEFLKTKKTPQAVSHKLKAKGGFTLIEMIVVVGIFSFITAIVLANNSRFNNDILVTNIAYEIALTIRQAQVFGLSVREFAVGGASEFNVGYGVYFSSGTVGSFVFYADRNRNNQYDSGEFVETFTLGHGNFIKRLCAVTGAGARRCSDTGDISWLSVVFLRPLPDATIKTSNPSESYSTAEVHISSPQGKERKIISELTGQISVQ